MTAHGYNFTMTKRKKYMSYVVAIIGALLVCVIIGGIRFINDIRQSEVKLSDITLLEDIRKSGKNLSDGQIKNMYNSWGPIYFSQGWVIGSPTKAWILFEGNWKVGSTPQIVLSWIISDGGYPKYKRINLYLVDGHWKLGSDIFSVVP